jgi:hypothetical protein
MTLKKIGIAGQVFDNKFVVGLDASGLAHGLAAHALFRSF